MTALVGRFGSEHMTASWIAMRYMHLSFMPAVGFSVAITSIVGRLIGEGSPKKPSQGSSHPQNWHRVHELVGLGVCHDV